MKMYHGYVVTYLLLGVENIFHLLIELAQLVNICILLHMNMLINLVQFERQKLLRVRK